MKIIHPILVAIGLLSAVVSCSQNKECTTLKLVSKCGSEPCTYKVEATGPFISDHLKRKWIVCEHKVNWITHFINVETVTNIYKRSCVSPPDPSICSKFNGLDETGCLRNQCSFLVKTTEPFGGKPGKCLIVYLDVLVLIGDDGFIVRYDFYCDSVLI